MTYESKFTKRYFDQIFTLFPEFLRHKGRRTFKAYDGLNNLFNLGYELLAWKVHRSLIKAKLEPYLGFLHSTQHGKPSLVCDVKELFPHLIDDFLIQHCQNFKKRDFVVKTEPLSRSKQGKRVYLNDLRTRKLMKQLNAFVETLIDITRMQVGKKMEKRGVCCLPEICLRRCGPTCSDARRSCVFPLRTCRCRSSVRV